MILQTLLLPPPSQQEKILTKGAHPQTLDNLTVCIVKVDIKLYTKNIKQFQQKNI